MYEQMKKYKNTNTKIFQKIIILLAFRFSVYMQIYWQFFLSSNNFFICFWFYYRFYPKKLQTFSLKHVGLVKIYKLFYFI